MKPARAANDPSTDPLLTFGMRYTLPVALVGIVSLIAFLTWMLFL